MSAILQCMPRPMINLVNASALRSDVGGSTPLSAERCQEYLAEYAESKVRLWTYHCSLSRLVLRIDRPANETLRPIDMMFVSVWDVRSPVHWLLGTIEICHDADAWKTVFGIPSANVAITASDLIIVVQDEYPEKVWELDSGQPDDKSV